MIHPIQPYLAFGSRHYHKRIINSMGIAHLFEYCYNSEQEADYLGIPDGSFDIFWDLTEPRPAAFGAGIFTHSNKCIRKKGHRYFGVRFMPGIVPDFYIGITDAMMNTEIDISSLDSTLSYAAAESLSSLHSFSERADFFLVLYTDLISHGPHENVSICKRNIYHECISYILNSRGLCQISELCEQSGYSERYINTIFKKIIGISAKKFCMFSRFQNAIDMLNHNNTLSFTEIALRSGYYDQAQFIHDFRNCAGMTPSAYRKKIISSNYVDKFVLE